MTDSSTAKTVERSILFADIVSSTALYESLGNIEAKKQVGERMRELYATVEDHRGHVVKSLGDGILCAFASREDAVRAAVNMCGDEGGSSLNIHVGVHCGEVVEDGGDIFGDAVNTVARIAALAKPSEILISKEMKESLPPFMNDIVRRVPPVSVKGKREPLELFAILRSGSDSGGGRLPDDRAGAYQHHAPPGRSGRTARALLRRHQPVPATGRHAHGRP